MAVGRDVDRTGGGRWPQGKTDSSGRERRTACGATTLTDRMDHDLQIGTSALASGSGKRGSESLDGASDAGGAAPVGEKRRKQKFPRKVLSCEFSPRRLDASWQLVFLV